MSEQLSIISKTSARFSRIWKITCGFLTHILHLGKYWPFMLKSTLFYWGFAFLEVFRCPFVSNLFRACNTICICIFMRIIAPLIHMLHCRDRKRAEILCKHRHCVYLLSWHTRLTGRGVYVSNIDQSSRIRKWKTCNAAKIWEHTCILFNRYIWHLK